MYLCIQTAVNIFIVYARVSILNFFRWSKNMIPLNLHVSGAASRVLKSLCARVLGLHDRNPKALNCLWMCLEATNMFCRGVNQCSL